MVDRISPERDVQRMTSFIPRAIANATPEQVHYEHGLQGVCSDLIFGISLTDYATGKNIRDGEIPRIVRLCIEEIDKRGLEAEGIYRVGNYRREQLSILADFSIGVRPSRKRCHGRWAVFA